MPAIALNKAIKDLKAKIKDDDNVVAWPRAFSRDDFYKAKYPQEVGYKPFGIWFGCGPEWIDRIVLGANPPTGKHYVYRLELDKSDYKIINSDSQLKTFSKRFSLGPFDVNWPLVAEQYSGIEISPFLYRVAGAHDWYYPWDVASGCTWDVDTVIGVEEL